MKEEISRRLTASESGGMNRNPSWTRSTAAAGETDNIHSSGTEHLCSIPFRIILLYPPFRVINTLPKGTHERRIQT